MSKKLKCILLVDDNAGDNFFHEREIKKASQETIVIEKNSATQALEYLKSKKDGNNSCPDLIFLDINMPGMNGWEFLQEYDQLDKGSQNEAIIIMLTTSENPDDVARAKTWSFVSDYIPKPLTRVIMKDIIDRYFK